MAKTEVQNITMQGDPGSEIVIKIENLEEFAETATTMVRYVGFAQEVKNEIQSISKWVYIATIFNLAVLIVNVFL